MDLEHTAIERLKAASDMSLRLYKQPLVITYSGGKDSDVLLHLAEISGIPFEVLHSLTTADAPQTVYHVRDTFRRIEAEFSMFPKIKAAYIRAFDRMIDERNRRGKLDGTWRIGVTGVDVYHWWMNDGVLPGQEVLYGFEEI